ncbi:MAG: immunoglobulin domain-containing protein [Bacteroidia bacterium]|nr:immunoglobulin domain-containing protein [Bacteroidia bacterium]
MNLRLGTLSAQTYTDTIAKIVYDSRDSSTYPIEKIGNQWWMAENLDIGVKVNSINPALGTDSLLTQTDNSIIEKYCYDNNDSLCEIYGGLYQWNEMLQYSPSDTAMTGTTQGVCPTGWHIPTDLEYHQLILSLDASAVLVDGQESSIAGGKLKETGTTHWSSPNTDATNTSGFTALPGGNRYFSNGSFTNSGGYSYFWSATENGSSEAWYRGLIYYGASVNRYGTNEAYGFSVRCLKDIIPPSITTQPVSVTLYAGCNALFTVSASGDEPLSYLWFHNGLEITSADNDTLLINNVTSADTGSYYCIVSNAAGNDTSTLAYLTLIPPMCGEYTIGSGQNFETLAAAIDSIEAAGVSCPVTFYFTDNYYMSDTVRIHTITGASAINTITFRPDSGVQSLIDINLPPTANNTGIAFDAADYIRFIGSYSDNDTIHNLTFRIQGGTNYKGFGFFCINEDGATGNIIKNCKITGFDNSSFTSAIYSSGNNHNNNVIDNNVIKQFTTGIYLDGNTNYPGIGNKIINNIIGSNNSMQYITESGIRCVFQRYLEISGNNISDIRSANNKTHGIWLESISHVMLSKNIIHDIVYEGNSEFGANGIYIYLQGSDTADVTIQNNFIEHIAGRSSTGIWNMTAGIFLGTSFLARGINLYNNSIYLTQDLSYGLYSSCYSTALAIDDGYTKVTMLNNILQNSLGGTYANLSGYGVFCEGFSNPFDTIDYNIYYITNHTNNWVAYPDKNLSAWQTWLSGSAGQDLNSYNQNPLFKSITDLHIQSGQAINGTSVSSVTDDIDGEPRKIPPDIGADENTPLCGNYNIGVGQDFETLGDAVNSMNLNGISCACNFYFTDELYNESPVIIDSIQGSSLTNTVKFKPAPGITPEIIIAAGIQDSSGIKLRNADYITFDGSNTEGGTTRDMTLRMTGIGYYSVLKFASTGQYGNTKYNSIINCIITGASNTGNYTYGIEAFSANSDNLLITNNKIEKNYGGIAVGNSAMVTI